MLTELLYPLQGGNFPIHFAARGGDITCVKRLLCTPGTDVNIKNRVSWSFECLIDKICMLLRVKLVTTNSTIG